MLNYLSGNVVRVPRNIIMLLLIVPFAQACTSRSVSTLETVDSAYSSSPSAPTKPTKGGVVAQGVCSSHVKTTLSNGLVAEKISPGHTHYIEFRVRESPAIPSGHMHVVYGELDGKAKPASFNYVGLFPKGSVVGLYTGMILPVGISGDLEPSVLDCNFRPAGAYRVSISAERYKRLLNRIAKHRKNPPEWRMLSYNCNHFAAELGEVAGLKAPNKELSGQMFSFVYFRRFLRVNGVKHRWQMANGKTPT